MKNSSNQFQKSNALPAMSILTNPEFIFIHLICLLGFWTGITKMSLVICVVLYFIRIWAITAGYHRYFSHKTFKTNRAFQFILAFMAQTSFQRGVLWWANHHRHHHLYADIPKDTHSPVIQGFFYAHMGWLLHKENYTQSYPLMRDFESFPELRWLDRNHNFPGLLLALIVLFFAGLPGFIIGFCLSTILVFHGTFFVNSLTHMFGTQRYLTMDNSRNNWFVALLTLGEGWHNNHHHYPASARQGFFWWEVDVTYYSLKVFSWLGIIWDIKGPSLKIKHPSFLRSHIIRRIKDVFREEGFDVDVAFHKIECIRKQLISTIDSNLSNFHQEFSLANEFEISKQILVSFRVNNAFLTSKMRKVLLSYLESFTELFHAIHYMPHEVKKLQLLIEQTYQKIFPLLPQQVHLGVTGQGGQSTQ